MTSNVSGEKWPKKRRLSKRKSKIRLRKTLNSWLTTKKRIEKKTSDVKSLDRSQQSQFRLILDKEVLTLRISSDTLTETATAMWWSSLMRESHSEIKMAKWSISVGTCSMLRQDPSLKTFREGKCSLPMRSTREEKYQPHSTWKSTTLTLTTWWATLTLMKTSPRLWKTNKASSWTKDQDESTLSAGWRMLVKATWLTKLAERSLIDPCWPKMEICRSYSRSKRSGST